ncbi:MAG: hypothetical protein K2H03_07900 [Muribaculaceae bacterium]|nr:hypothetical protein [Muribaculaceae bacterium]
MGMKKLYTLSLAFALALTASATQHHTAEVKAHPSSLTPLINKLEAAGITAPEKAPVKALEADEDIWTNVGTATMVDGWVCPAFGDDQFEYPYEVDLERSVSNPNKYRVVNPYKGKWSLAFLNSSDHDGYIQFDLSDPDHVTFDIVEAGLFIANMGSTFEGFYCYNALSYFCHHYEMSPEEVIAQLGDECPYTTYKDNVVELNYVVLTEDNGSQKTVYDACVGNNDDPYAGIRWDDTNMCAKIILPEKLTDGVDAVLPATDNGEVRYFNLQGVELAKPAAGSVVIRLQNGKAEKTIMK